jgi:hypothetical protein
MMDARSTPNVELAAALGRVRRRWRRVAASTAAARLLAVAAVVLALAAAGERTLTLSDGGTLVLAIAALGAVAIAAAVLLWPLRRSPDDRRVARFVEECHPEHADAIVSAVDVDQREDGGQAFGPLVVASAARRLAALDLDGLVDRRRVRLAAWSAAAAAAACLVALGVALPLLDRAGEAAYVRFFPSSIALTVMPGDLRVAAGTSATIVATVRGRVGTLGRVAAVITLDAAGRAVTVPMERVADGYRFTIPKVERSFHYMVSAGPATSRAYAVTALHPSRVERIDLQYDFPSFTGLPPRLDRDAGDVYAPAGTRVRVIVHADKAVHDGALAFSQGRAPAPLTRIDDRTFAASLTIDDESAYRVGLVDPDGLRSESVEYFVRVMDDRPPEVHILRPGNDEGITPLDEVPIEARADDDYGIQKMDLVYSVAGGPEKVVPFQSLSGTELARVGAHLLAVEDLKVKPGDVIAYYARAWDVPRAKASTMTESELFFLEVRPFNEEYSLAQSQAAMQAATGTQLEGLISSQKEIISATWNLERRSAAGRSAADVKGVADAQVELKGRAERAAGAQPPRRRYGGGQPFERQAPERPQTAPADDPVQKAVAAMGRAVDELQGQKTSGALPHEMAALNALLQAQAAIREKQVGQGQTTGGNPFGNRQTQDLSSLFDRELKRQQKSNYENKTSAEAQDETAKAESALDRIRDLARRQEELNQKQRDIAKSGLSPEEAARQLEKLTREQETLRHQLEEAARGTRGAQGASGAESAQGAPRANGDAASDVQTALQKMRDAAADGQKADAAGAAAEGRQAADALRRAEAGMERGQPNAQKRALGDLQLESQQIAQEQRRIAGEADRLDREGGGTGDARRRLANNKDTLADRVDALQQSAARQPGSAGAARDLASEQVGARMRAGAQQLRDGGAGSRMAPAEQQMADALDRVARAIGQSDAGGARGNAAEDASRLAGDLDDLRDARDRVARLERQMRDAQGAQGAQGARGAQVAELQRQLDDELRRTRDLLGRVQQTTHDPSGNWASPEEHEWSGSAPGTEAFKQDYAAWQSLAAGVSQALERAESSSAGRLSAALARDRLRAGGSERVPDAYRRQVSRYFEAIAVKQGTGRQ